MVIYLPKLSSVQVQPIRQVDDVGLKTYSNAAICDATYNMSMFLEELEKWACE